jgi:hypothetical protein
MVASYTDLNTLYVPADGTPPTIDWHNQLETNFSSFRQRVGARISTVAVQAFGFATTNKVTLGTVDWDVGTFTGTANRLTVPVGWGGVYLVQGVCAVASVTSGTADSVVVDMRKNAGAPPTNLATSIHAASIGVGSVSATLSATFTSALVAGDFVEMFVTGGGAATPVHHPELGCHLSMVWLHP